MATGVVPQKYATTFHESALHAEGGPCEICMDTYEQLSPTRRPQTGFGYNTLSPQLI